MFDLGERARLGVNDVHQRDDAKGSAKVKLPFFAERRVKSNTYENMENFRACTAQHRTTPHSTAQRSTLGVQTALSSESHIMLSLDFVSPSLLLPPSSHLGRLSPHHTFPSTCIGLLWHPILTACTSLYLCFTLYSQLHSLASPIISSLITAFRISHLVSHQHRALITRLHPFAR